jgi:hypothetical protein
MGQVGETAKRPFFEGEEFTAEDAEGAEKRQERERPEIACCEPNQSQSKFVPHSETLRLGELCALCGEVLLAAENE